jgi:uncharacterized membrane protein
MSGYDLVVFFHVLSVIVWVGGGVMLQILLARASRAGPESVASFSEHAAWTSSRIFIPASSAAFASGIWAVFAGPWSFGDSWIVVGLIGFAISSLIGTFVLGPTSKKMNALAAERGPNDPVVTHLRRRIDLVGRVDLIVLTLVVFNMVVKPGT